MTIGAIIILYNPDIKQTIHSIEILLPQVDKIYLIDNSYDSHQEHFPQNDNITYIPLFKNTGIASAQNFGIKNIIKDKCDFALFSDQDRI